MSEERAKKSLQGKVKEAGGTGGTLVEENSKGTQENAPRLGKTYKTHGKTLCAWEKHQRRTGRRSALGKNIEDAINYQKNITNNVF